MAGNSARKRAVPASRSVSQIRRAMVAAIGGWVTPEDGIGPMPPQTSGPGK